MIERHPITAASSISAIVPMYKAVPLVAEAIESILAQTLPITRIIAVEDGPSDGSADFVATRFPTVHVVRKVHGGLADTLNHGLAHVRTELVAFLDHDDRWLPRKTAAQVAALAADPSLDMVFCHAEQFVSTDDGERRVAVLPGIAKAGGLFRMEAVRRVGPFGAGHDFLDWYARAMEAGLRHAVLDEVLFQRRIHEHNMGRTGKADQTRSYLVTLKAMLDRRRHAAGDA
ncbi:MAG: glycosyltransferase family A protein [Planctomycetia bacterium]